MPNFNNNFHLKHTEGALGKDGKPLYEEDFYLDEKLFQPHDTNLIKCYGYGECLWRRGYGFRKKAFDWSFSLITDGNLIFKDNQNLKIIAPGEMIVTSRGLEYSMRVGSAGFVKKSVILAYGQILQLISNDNLLPRLCHLTTISPLITKLFSDCKEIVTSQSEIYPAPVLAQKVFALVQEIKRLSQTATYPDELKKIMNFIEKNIVNSNLSLEFISTRCNLSIRKLSRLFHKNAGISPANYIIALRMQNAANLLKLSGLSIGEISEICGYKSISFFSSYFKKRYGCPPSVYRQKERMMK